MIPIYLVSPNLLLRTWLVSPNLLLLTWFVSTNLLLLTWFVSTNLLLLTRFVSPNLLLIAWIVSLYTSVCKSIVDRNKEGYISVARTFSVCLGLLHFLRSISCESCDVFVGLYRECKFENVLRKIAITRPSTLHHSAGKTSDGKKCTVNMVTSVICCTRLVVFKVKCCYSENSYSLFANKSVIATLLL